MQEFLSCILALLLISVAELHFTTLVIQVSLEWGTELVYCTINTIVHIPKRFSFQTWLKTIGLIMKEKLETRFVPVLKILYLNFRSFKLDFCFLVLELSDFSGRQAASLVI